MNFNAQLQTCARFQCIAHKGVEPTDKELSSGVWFDNIVLDSGLVTMSSSASAQYIHGVQVGSGASAPVKSQTALDAPIAITTTTTSHWTETQNITDAPYFVSIKGSYRFDIGAAKGILREVGLVSRIGNKLWNRALIRDALGEPTSLTILADDYLTVHCEVRVYPAPPTSGTFNLIAPDGSVRSAHTYNVYPMINTKSGGVPEMQGPVKLGSLQSNTISKYVTMYDTELVDNSITGTFAGVGVVNDSSHTDQAKSLQDNPTTTSCRVVCALPLNRGNAALKGFRVAMGGLPCNRDSIRYNITIDPPITKTDLMTMAFTFTGTWSQYTGEV